MMPTIFEAGAKFSWQRASKWKALVGSVQGILQKSGSSFGTDNSEVVEEVTSSIAKQYENIIEAAVQKLAAQCELPCSRLAQDVEKLMKFDSAEISFGSCAVTQLRDLVLPTPEMLHMPSLKVVLPGAENFSHMHDVAFHPWRVAIDAVDRMWSGLEEAASKKQPWPILGAGDGTFFPFMAHEATDMNSSRNILGNEFGCECLVDLLVSVRAFFAESYKRQFEKAFGDCSFAAEFVEWYESSEHASVPKWSAEEMNSLAGMASELQRVGAFFSFEVGKTFSFSELSELPSKNKWVEKAPVLRLEEKDLSMLAVSFMFRAAWLRNRMMSQPPLVQDWAKHLIVLDACEVVMADLGELLKKWTAWDDTWADGIDVAAVVTGLTPALQSERDRLFKTVLDNFVKLVTETHAEFQKEPLSTLLSLVEKEPLTKARAKFLIGICGSNTVMTSCESFKKCHAALGMCDAAKGHECFSKMSAEGVSAWDSSFSGARLLYNAVVPTVSAITSMHSLWRTLGPSETRPGVVGVAKASLKNEVLPAGLASLMAAVVEGRERYVPDKKRWTISARGFPSFDFLELLMGARAVPLRLLCDCVRSPHAESR